MSQSDYIRYKKVSNQLLEVNKLNAILDSQDYTQFKQYYLESNIPNTNITFNQLNLQGYTNVFDINKKIKYCPTNNFIMCNNTNIRDNRVLVKDHRTDAYAINNYPIRYIQKI